MPSATETDALEAILRRLVGKRAWGVSIGVGSFLTIEFGRALAPGRSGRSRGEWQLWLYGCDWRLEEETRVLVGSEDPRPSLKTGVERLEGLNLLAVRLLPPALDGIFSFEGGVTLRLFAAETVDMESWKLFTPEQKVAVIGPGSQWIYRSTRSSSGRQAVEVPEPEI